MPFVRGEMMAAVAIPTLAIGSMYTYAQVQQKPMFWGGLAIWGLAALAGGASFLCWRLGNSVDGRVSKITLQTFGVLFAACSLQFLTIGSEDLSKSFRPPPPPPGQVDTSAIIDAQLQKLSGDSYFTRPQRDSR